MGLAPSERFTKVSNNFFDWVFKIVGLAFDVETDKEVAVKFEPVKTKFP